MANEREDEESEHSGRYRPTTAIKRTSAAIELMETQGRCMADLKKRYVKDKVCKGKASDEGSGAGSAGPSTRLSDLLLTREARPSDTRRAQSFLTSKRASVELRHAARRRLGEEKIVTRAWDVRG